MLEIYEWKFGFSILVYLSYPLKPDFEVHFDYSVFCFPIFVINNFNKYSYYKFINAKFEFSILVYL